MSMYASIYIRGAEQGRRCTSKSPAAQNGSPIMLQDSGAMQLLQLTCQEAAGYAVGKTQCWRLSRGRAGQPVPS